jgi:hypothetical protein
MAKPLGGVAGGGLYRRLDKLLRYKPALLVICTSAGGDLFSVSKSCFTI